MQGLAQRGSRLYDDDDIDVRVPLRGRMAPVDSVEHLPLTIKVMISEMECFVVNTM